MKNSSTIYLLIIVNLLLVSLCSCKKENSKVVPTVSIGIVSNITESTANVSGEVNSDGGADITARGVCWSTDENPTIANNKTIDGIGVGNFNSTIIDLSSGVKYYIRAYATNEVGTAYSKQINFSALASLPVISTNVLSDITAKTVKSGGNITSDGGAAITNRGICWAITSNPTINDDITQDGSGSGIFTSEITGLLPLTKYYFRAYATNSAGTAYGEELTATTLENLPTNPYRKSISTYDSDGKRIEEVIMIWDTETNDWINNFKYTFSYFAYKKMWVNITYTWDNISNEWQNFGKYDNYSSQNNILSRTYYTWNSYNWKEYDGYNYTFNFDNMNRISQEIETDTKGYYDENAGMWRYKKEKTDFKYDSKGIEIETTSASWDYTYGWSDPGFYSAIFNDQNGNPTKKLVYIWNSAVNDYILSEKFEYTYDAMGYQTGYIMYTL